MKVCCALRYALDRAYMSVFRKRFQTLELVVCDFRRRFPCRDMWSVSQYIWAGSPPLHRPTMEFWESSRCEHSKVQLHQFQQYHPSSGPHQAAIPKRGELSFPRDKYPLSWPAECFGRHSGSDFSLY